MFIRLQRNFVAVAVASLCLVLAGCKDKSEPSAPAETAQDRYSKQLQQGAEDARAEAAKQLGEFRTHESIGALAAALRDGSRKVRHEASESLARIRTAESLKKLRDGVEELEKKNVEGWKEMRDDYDDAIDDLADAARKGDQHARDVLKDLDEKWEGRPSRDRSIDVRIDVN